MLNKQFFVDVETTGVDHRVNGIWQIAARMVINGECVETFKREMKPFPNQLVNSKALEVGGITMEQLRGFEEPAAVYTDLVKMLKKYVDKFNKKDKFFFIAYNAFFDSEFVRAWMGNNGDKYYGSWFWTPYIDVMQLAAFVLAERRAELENFKLETVLAYFGIPLENAHDGMCDIVATEQLFNRFVADGLSMRPAA